MGSYSNPWSKEDHKHFLFSDYLKCGTVGNGQRPDIVLANSHVNKTLGHKPMWVKFTHIRRLKLYIRYTFVIMLESTKLWLPTVEFAPQVLVWTRRAWSLDRSQGCNAWLSSPNTGNTSASSLLSFKVGIMRSTSGNLLTSLGLRLHLSSDLSWITQFKNFIQHKTIYC